MIYRVTVRTTGSVQPRSGGTFWQRDVRYCGTSLEEARVVYLREVAADRGGSYGNPCRTTDIEQFESEPDDIGNETAAEVETADEE